MRDVLHERQSFQERSGEKMGPFAGAKPVGGTFCHIAAFRRRECTFSQPELLPEYLQEVTDDHIAFESCLRA
jgi:hypothetical protein